MRKKVLRITTVPVSFKLLKGQLNMLNRLYEVGAGSVVDKDIPDGVLALGNRCRIIKSLE